MNKPEWGLFPEEAENARIYWGARAIISKGYLDLLPDRQSFVVGEDVTEGQKQEFIDFINSTVIPFVEACVSRKVTKNIHADCTEKRKIVADDRCSGGYLYIGAWES